MDLDDLQAPLGDDFDILPEAEPFPPLIDPAARRSQANSTFAEDEEASETAEAPQRKSKKAAKRVQWDQEPELRNADLAQMNIQYITNMGNQALQRFNHRLPIQAKKNGAFWVFGAGIGGVGQGIGTTHAQHPLSVFSGASLMAAVRGISITTVSKKRSRSPSDEEESDSDARRVRARKAAEGDQVVRGAEVLSDDMQPLGDQDVSLARLFTDDTVESNKLMSARKRK